VELMVKAYEFARKVHGAAKRASGEPFIQHPLHAAYILAELKLDVSSIVAALLHDVVEDSNVSLDVIKKEFGQEVALLVDGVTNVTKLRYATTDDVNAENIRKMLLATTKDIRVIIIKLADKLHNMRTLKYLPADRRVKIAEDALHIYAPLAYRLGIASIKWELEDIAFKYLQPETYQMFKQKFGKKRWQREIEVIKARRIVEKALSSAGIEAQVTGRPKHFYSIYRKMIRTNRSFEELHDLMALRVITSSMKDCYEAIGIIHNLWKPIPGEFKDYIAMPKVNMYQSLHTAVIGPQGAPIEIQIRTEEMHKTAEEGIAAHWQYKGAYGDKEFDKKLSWLRQILDWQRDNKDAKDFMEVLKVDFFEEEIYVFTPKGKVVQLPKGSTPLDFAYAVHSSIGDTCTGALVNGRIVPLRYGLKNGDIVNILTSKNATPHRDWLKIVKTARAKDRIKHTLKSRDVIPVKVPTKIESFGEQFKGSLITLPFKAVFKLAKCCHPLPGDSITGHLGRNKRVIVHRSDCPNIKRRVRSLVALSWNYDFNSDLQLKVVATDRVGLFADILNTVATAGTNVRNAKAKMISEDLAECSFSFVPENTDHVKDIVSRIKHVQNVRKVFIANK
ncbi:MAG: bifunctional (p)ppGpp synthetase/guanosine-3',5'-bis(diphosphate) 3'-pyrophosphohydrolase, partial [archaeon]